MGSRLGNESRIYLHELIMYTDRDSLNMLRIRSVYTVLIALMIGVGCLRVISTYSIFSQTWDEPAHIGAGMQWLDQGLYTFEQMHPPLARVMGALGLYLNGVRSRHGIEDNTAFQEGNAILQFGGQYERNLALSRLGILPFFIIVSIIVALWARNLAGTLSSLLGTLLFTTLPPVLAHSGIATTDIACAAMVAAAFYSLTLWAKKPTLRRSIFLGIATGLGVLVKFTAIYFLALGYSLIFVSYTLLRPRKPAVESPSFSNMNPWIKGAVVAILLCGLTVWAGYRFSVYPRVSAERRPHEALDQIVGAQGALHDISYFLVENAPVPAPEFWMGVYTTITQNEDGRETYFLGEPWSYGHWNYYPVVFAIKTPLPFLLLSLSGLFLTFREILRKNPHSFQLSIPPIAVAAVFLIGMGSNMNLGIRQMLSVYPLLAVIGGYGAATLVKSFQKSRLLGPAWVTALLSWQLIASVGAHPDYLAYFNELAGAHPEEILVDSDLDWGQDLKRLAQTLRERGINEVSIRYHGSDGIDLDLFNLPAWSSLLPYQKESGWVAISISSLKMGTGQAPYNQFNWLEDYQPVERIGKSILLYYIP
jgi:4-amino-4-deoxy-L-arabinose transferase-like glycosyltransferase